jgi:GNAT superfamily N-acetyltransferase
MLAGEWRIRRAKRSDSSQFLKLVVALANFERLSPPTPSAGRRMCADIFDRRRLNLLVAESERKLIGYVLYFFTYSSFLARPTLYIEDLFVLGQERGRGVGQGLFLRCAEEAVKKGCGRMEWSVLNWNSRAIRFYERMGARRLKEWSVFRLDGQRLKALGARIEQ